MKINYLLLPIVCLLFSFTSVKPEKKVSKPIKPIETEAVIVVDSLPTLDSSPLTEEELNSKDKIHALRSVISEEEMEVERVLYYGFYQYDNLMTLRVLNYLMTNPSVKKLALTKSSFAIIVTEDFDSKLLEKNIKNTGLTCNPITMEEYIESVNEINSK